MARSRFIRWIPAGARRRSIVTAHSHGPLYSLRAKVASKDFRWDHRQEQVALVLQGLTDRLLREPNGAAGSLHGLYLHGSVGTGKTMLMDLFFDSIQRGFSVGASSQTSLEQTVAAELLPTVGCRAHFHEFMLDVHAMIRDANRGANRVGGDPLPAIASRIAQSLDTPDRSGRRASCRLLCLDEFQVTDIVDAALLTRLFDKLWSPPHNVVVVATSNRPPEDLYTGGLNYSTYMPAFVELLRAHNQVVDIDRLEPPPPAQAREGLPLEEQGAVVELKDVLGNGGAGSIGSGEPVDYRRTGTRSNILRTFLVQQRPEQASVVAASSKRHALAPLYHQLVNASRAGELNTEPSLSVLPSPETLTLDVRMGRQLTIPDCCFHLIPSTEKIKPGSLHTQPCSVGMSVCLVPFDALCAQPAGAADYLALASTFDAVLLHDVPQFTASMHNEARRFITLIDVLYDSKTVFGCSSSVGPDELFTRLGHGDEDAPHSVKTKNAVSATPHLPLGVSPGGVSNAPGGTMPTLSSLSVSGEGGSSGRSTTMVGDAEWSATGRIGVSLVALSQMDDLVFSIGRSVSRLVEMQCVEYIAEVQQTKPHLRLPEV